MNRYNVDALRCNLEATKFNLESIKMKFIDRSKVVSTDQKLDQQIKS